MLGHDPWRRYRLHPDHRAAGFLTLDALVAARDPHFFADLGLPPHRPDALLLFEADLPNHVEDARRVRADQDRRAALPHEPVGVDHGHRRPGGCGASPIRSGAGFAAKVHRQLVDHGSVAGRQRGEAFHLMTDL